MFLTQIGEIGVIAEGRSVTLRPSLYAMSRLGTPQEIVSIFADVFDPIPSKFQFEAALSVLNCCCEEEDLSDLFGSFEADEKTMKYVPGLAPVEHILPLARCLLKHGIVSDLPPLPVKEGREEPKYEKEFDARTFVALAIAHLGASSTDAWKMTMTELVGALRAKFPPMDAAKKSEPKQAAPTLAEHEETMKWFDKIEAKRKKKQGVH